MRRLLLVVAACVLAALAGVAYLSTRVDNGAVLRASGERVAILTGKRMEVRGTTDVRFFPVPRFELHDVVLAERFSEKVEEVASIDVVRGSVALLPLLVGQIRLKDFVLVRPRVTLVIDRRGQPNWWIPRRAETKGNAPPETSDSADGDEPPADVPAIPDLPVGSFRIEDGSLTYDNRHTGTRQTVTAVDATVAWSHFAAPLTVAGGLIWNGEAVRFNLSADTPLDFMNHGKSPSRIRLASGVLDVDFDGNAHYTSDLQLEGGISLSAPSARGLLRWIGTDLGTGPGLNAIELSGKLNLIGKTLSLSDLSVELDGNEAEGGVKVDLGKPRTGLQGTLAFDTLDLGVYKTRNGDTEVEPPSTEQAMSTVVDLSVLDRFAIDLRMSAGQVSYGNLTFGRSAGTVTVRKGVLDLGVGEAMLYGGMAQGTITAASAPDGAQIKVAIGVDKTDIGLLLTALFGSTRISGQTTARINLSGTGRTVADIIAGLSGDAKVKIAPGEIIGIDVETLLAALETGVVEGWPATKASTAVDELTATYTVVGGNAATDDFSLKGPKIDVSAEGEVRLVSASVAGHGTADLGGEAVQPATPDNAAIYSVPFVIEGPIANPVIYPDPIWLLNRPTATTQEIEQIRKNLQQGTPEDVVEDLIERGRDTPPQLTPQMEQPSAPQQ